MTLSIAQLKTPPTRDECTEWLLERARSLGFQTTGWQEGRITNTILNTVATGMSLFGQVAADTVKNVYNDEATGAGLTKLSLNRFGNTRGSSEKAAGGMVFTSTGTVAHSIQVGQIVVADASGIQFSNLEAATVPAGGEIGVNMEAVLEGDSGSIPNNSVLTLITPLAGVTVTNPGPGDLDADGQDDPWYDIRTGVDPETDLTISQRNSSKIATTSVEKTVTAVENLALKQDGVGKVKVIHNNPRGPGTVDVYVASGGNLTSTAEKEAAQAAFAAATLFTEAVWPPTNTPEQSRYEIKDPSTIELNITGVVYYDPQYTQEAVESALSTSLSDFVSLMPIGGVEYVTDNGTVTIGDISEAIETTIGVRSATLTSPTGNIDVSATQLVQAPSDWITGRLNLSAVTS